MEHTELGVRLQRVIDGLGLTQIQAAVDAKVHTDTIRLAIRGRLRRVSTIHQLQRWVEKAERRLERRVPRA